MNNYFKQILFEGDEDPKINIICDVLSEGLRSEFRDRQNRKMTNVVMMHCNSFPFIDYGNNTTVYSPFVPYGTEIIVLFNGKIGKMSSYDEIVYLEPYPFTLGEKIRSELEQAENILKENSKIAFKIMFYRNTNQHSGADDLIGIDQALKNAPDQIKKIIFDSEIVEAIDYCVYRTPKDLINVVYGGCGDLSVAISTCTERFKEFSERIKPDVFYGPYGDYKDTLEFGCEYKYSVLVQTESINRLTKFNKVKGTNDILNQYVKNYTDAYQELILELIEEVYIKTVGDICFWDLEKDIIKLKEGAKRVISDTLSSSSKEKEKCPEFESDYNNYVRNMLKMDTKFAEKAVSLVENEILNYLHSYLVRKEEVLANTFV